MGERGSEGCGFGGAHGTDEECVVLEGLAGVVDERERGERLRAEPVGEERLDQRGGGGVGGEGVVVIGDGGDEGGVGGRSGLAGGAVGDEEAGRAEAEGLGVEEGGGDAGRFGRGQVGVVADGGERLAQAAEEGGVGRVARVLDGETEADGCGGLAEAGAARRTGRDVAPSPRKTGGAEAGSQRTLPNPRRAVSEGEMESQSAARAWSPGAPMRVRRSAEGGIAPE